MNSENRTPLKPFRAFVTSQYFANRDEYDSCGQTQPHTLAEYYRANISMLKARYRLTLHK